MKLHPRCLWYSCSCPAPSGALAQLALLLHSLHLRADLLALGFIFSWQLLLRGSWLCFALVWGITCVRGGRPGAGGVPVLIPSKRVLMALSAHSPQVRQRLACGHGGAARAPAAPGGPDQRALQAARPGLPARPAGEHGQPSPSLLCPSSCKDLCTAVLSTAALFPFSSVYSPGNIQFGMLPASFLNPIFDDDKRKRKHFKFCLEQVFLKQPVNTWIALAFSPLWFFKEKAKEKHLFECKQTVFYFLAQFDNKCWRGSYKIPDRVHSVWRLCDSIFREFLGGFYPNVLSGFCSLPAQQWFPSSPLPPCSTVSSKEAFHGIMRSVFSAFFLDHEAVF